MKGCVILIYFVVNTLFCDAVCILCITWIYTRNDFVSCALVVWNGTGICKVSCYQLRVKFVFLKHVLKLLCCDRDMLNISRNYLKLNKNLVS